MKLAFSTCWNSRRHKNGSEMISEIINLGFRHIELSHGLRVSHLDGILAARKTEDFEISSVHNFLPMPVEIMTDAPDCYEFTSHRKQDRERAVRLTRQTIDWAARLGAPFVVVHCGQIRSLRLTQPLRTLIMSNQLLTAAYGKKKLAAVRAREAHAQTYISRALECLADVVDYAGTKGVKIGIENRDYYEAIPSEREIPGFLRQLDSAHVGYWHDFGHAHVKEHLGLLDHKQWLARSGHLVIGAHLHDVKWPARDHCLPFSGDIPYKNLLSFLPSNCPVVLELSPKILKEDIQSMHEQWKKTFPQCV